MIKDIYETIKAFVFRGEKRVGAVGQTGRVFESSKKSDLHGANSALGNAKLSGEMKVIRADGTVETIKLGDK